MPRRSSGCARQRPRTPSGPDEQAKKAALAGAWDALGRLRERRRSADSRSNARWRLIRQTRDAKAQLANAGQKTCPAGQSPRESSSGGEPTCVASSALTSAELEQMLAKNPGDQAAASQLAHAYVEQKEYGKAEPLVRQLLLKSPQDADQNYRYAFLLMHLHRPQPAQQFLLKALQLKPDLPDAYGDLAVVAAENKDYPLSLKALDGRARFSPETAATYFLRATDLDHLHDEKTAAIYYHKFLESSHGESPDSDWQAKHRLIAIDPKERKK